MKLILAFLLITQTDLALARKFALVVGGTARDTSPRDSKTPKFHEFGQATARVSKGLQSQGYEVTTLFDTAGISGENKSARKWTEDHNKFRSLNSQAATQQNIERALERIVREASSGDVFELNLFAHGYRGCGDDEGGMQGLSVSDNLRRNQVAGCSHKITLADPVTGENVLVETAVIKRHIETLDRKGVKTNLNLASCHSGAAQELFTGLRNTCTTFLASANNVGLGCFPSDEEGDTSFTSAIDMIMTSQWIGIADELANDPYFKQDRCLRVSRDHYRQNGIEGDNRYELYMNARKHDKNPHEPTISSLLGQNYFTEGNFSAILANAQNLTADRLVCLPNVEARVDELLTFGGELATTQLRQDIRAKLSLLGTKIDEYNALVAEQEREIGKGIKRAEELSPISGTQASGEKGSPASGSLEIPADPAEQSEQISKDSNVLPSSGGADLDFGDMPTEVKQPEDRAKYWIGRTLEKSKEVMAIERDIIAQVNEQILRPRLEENDPCLR